MKQGVYQESEVQKYPIGLRYAMDERVFRYCHAGSELFALMEGHCGNFPREGETDAVVYPAGTFKITIPMNPNGVHYVEEQKANYWKDGYIWIMQYPIVTGAGQFYRIKSSTAAVGGFVTLTLYDPLDVTVTASTWITAWPNVYGDIRGGVDDRMSNVCIPLIPVTSGYYFWGQTWGPIFANSGQTPGREDCDREVYFHPRAADAGQRGITPGSQVDFTAGKAIPQRAGFLITNTNTWTNADDGAELGGDQLYMLQLSP